MSKKVLGRGLEALIPQSIAESAVSEGVVHVAVDDVAVNPNQPRKQFDEAKIQALSESIRQDGVLQPIVVRKRGDRYELIMGERRLQAARLAGVPRIPAVVRDAAEVDSLRLALVENLQREDLNPIEVAEAYRLLIDRFGLAQEDVAAVAGKDRSSVANTLRLLGLPEEVRALVADGRLTEGHARALLGLTTRAQQIALANRIVRDRLNVRDVENATGAARNRRGRPAVTKEKPAHIRLLEKAIGSHLGTRVSVDEKRGGRGRLIIEFYSHEEFERLADMMHIPLPR